MRNMLIERGYKKEGVENDCKEEICHPKKSYIKGTERDMQTA